MANPMALGYANDTIQGDSPSISYASVYPLGMFLRVIIAQVLIMFVASWKSLSHKELVFV